MVAAHRPEMKVKHRITANTSRVTMVVFQPVKPTMEETQETMLLARMPHMPITLVTATTGRILAE